MGILHARLAIHARNIEDSLRATRSDVIQALNHAILAASPESILKEKAKVVNNKLVLDHSQVDLSDTDRVIVIGGGKAAASMAVEMEKLLGSRITAGIVNVPDYLEPRPRTRRVRLNDATHPVPSEMGVKGVQEMLQLVGRPSRRDLIICLISGGGSALLPLPIEGVSLSDEKTVTNLRLKSGAPIDEINIVRKHISAVKGGRLAERLYPARVLTLIISDVVGDRLDSIASGPTVPDSSTYADARRVLVRYDIWKRAPKSVRKKIENGIANKSEETPKEDSKIFSRVSNVLVGTNKKSCEAAAEYLRSEGYKTSVLSTHVQGEARDIGRFYSGILRDMRDNVDSSAMIVGGETTVTITKKSGLGGRNQELVLASALGIEGLEGAVIASMGTDGVDGPTDAAGAIADYTTTRRAKHVGLNGDSYLHAHDSYHFFCKLGDLIRTGPPGTNVNDNTVLAMKHPILRSHHLHSHGGNLRRSSIQAHKD